MENENAERSVAKNFSLKNRHIDFMSKVNLGSEWFQQKLDEEILSQKLYEYAKKSPAPNPENYEITKSIPPFQLVMETKQDVDGRVIGHGNVRRMKCLSPENNAKIEVWFETCRGKTYPAWHIPFEKLKVGEFVIFEDFSVLDRCSLLENGQLLYEGDPIPYDIQPTAEFVARQQAEIQAYQIKAQHEQIAREQENEKVRLLGIQLNKERGEREARELIQKEKSIVNSATENVAPPQNENPSIN
jgi:hypothetical protein